MAAAALTIAVGAAEQQAPPVFRAGTDVVVVDVVVLDKSGTPVTNLTAGDFEIVAGGRPRKVLSAEYIAARTETRPLVAGRPGEPAVPAPSTNAVPTSGRSFIFVVDVENIRAGEGRGAMAAIDKYLDRLNAGDRVGLVSLPYGTPRVELTTNRKMVRAAVAKIAGASNRDRDCEMSLGEASQIERMDSQVLEEFAARLRLMRCAPGQGLPPGSDMQRAQQTAERVMDTHRRRTKGLFDSLGALAESMASIDGTKAIVLVSEGLANDEKTIDDQRKFAARAERARVTLYGLQLAVPLVEAAFASATSGSRSLDTSVGFDAMSTVAAAARGTAFRGAPDVALAQIDAELGGYYLISFARDPGDREGRRVGLKIRTTREGLDVRARTEYTPQPLKPASPKPAADPRVAIGELLRLPVAVSEVALDVDVYAVPAPVPAGPSTNTGEVRAVMAVSFAAGVLSMSALGYEMSREGGAVVSDHFDTQLRTQALPGERSLYLAAVMLPPGAYRLKLAALSTDGRRGSIEHPFTIEAWPAGPLRMSDVFIGEPTIDGLLPSPRLTPSAQMLGARVEVHATAVESFAGATLRLELRRPGDAMAVASAPLVLSETPHPLRRLAEGSVSLAAVPPGDYVVTVILDAASMTQRRSRLVHR